jgi:hypothetical protein
MDITNPDRTIELIRLLEGTYYWTIQAETPEGYVISASAPSSFRVLPIDITPVSASISKTVFEGLEALYRPGKVQWSSQEIPQSVRFVLSDNPNPLAGTALMDIANPGEEISLIRLRAGNYYWTIRAETEDGLNISTKTPESFSVLPIPPLPAPERLHPENASLIGPAELQSMDAITFSWDQVSEANAYILSIRPEGDESREIFCSDAIPALSYTFNDLPSLDVGTFVWQVEAVRLSEDGYIEQRGIVNSNRLIIDIPLPGIPRRADMGTLYGQ